MEQAHGLEFCGVKFCKGMDCKGGRIADSKIWGPADEKQLIKDRWNLLESEREFQLEKQRYENNAYLRMSELAAQRPVEAIKADERMAAKKLIKRSTPREKISYPTFSDRLADGVVGAYIHSMVGPALFNVAFLAGATFVGVSTATVLTTLAATTPPIMIGFAIFGFVKNFKSKKRKKRKKRKFLGIFTIKKKRKRRK